MAILAAPAAAPHQRPMPARLPGSPRFLLVVGVAVLLHAALLAPMQFSVARVLVALPSMTVRMVAPPVAAAVNAQPSLADETVRQVAADTALSHDQPAPAPARVAPSPLANPVVPGRMAARSRAAPEAARAPPPQPDSAAAAKSSTLPPAPSYLAAGRLDPGPRPLHEIEPDYPPRAGKQQGVVVLRLLISEQGIVDNAAVVDASPAGFFEESALEAFGRARFSPGLLLGLPVKSQVTIEVEFTPINRGADVSGRTY